MPILTAAALYFTHRRLLMLKATKKVREKVGRKCGTNMLKFRSFKELRENNNRKTKAKHMMVRLEYNRTDGEIVILEGKFGKRHISNSGVEYFTFRCFDKRDGFRRIHPDKIISISGSTINN